MIFTRFLFRGVSNLMKEWFSPNKSLKERDEDKDSTTKLIEFIKSKLLSQTEKKNKLIEEIDVQFVQRIWDVVLQILQTR